MDLTTLFLSRGIPEDFRKLALDSLPDLPDRLWEMIFQKHLDLEPIRRVFQLRSVSRNVRQFLSSSQYLELYPAHESWMLKQTCEWRSNSTVSVHTHDVSQNKHQLIPVPAEIAESCNRRTEGELRVSASEGGETGLIYLDNGELQFQCNRTSVSDGSLAWRNTRECFVLNPMTKSVKRLLLHSSVRQIDRFSSGYLSWASCSGGDEMRPFLLDPETYKWNEIGSGFITKGQIRKEKAVVNEVVYQRYQSHRPDLKDLLIIYDIRQKSFGEESTTGLPDNMVDEYLFQHDGHIYLAALLPTERCEKDCRIYKLEVRNSQKIWSLVSKIPPDLLSEVTISSSELGRLKFLYMDHELLVIHLVTRRTTNGIHVSLDRRRFDPCRAIVAYAPTSNSWRKDNSRRLGQELDDHTTVFRPRLDIRA